MKGLSSVRLARLDLADPTELGHTHPSKGKVNPMIKKAGILCLFAAALVSTAFAQEGAVPKGVRHLDHVYVIMMENHAYAQIVNNPDAPFVNHYIKHANYATNYFAVGHPSLTNYLEIVGGSNFGVRTDNSPDWHNSACTPNIIGKTVSLESTSRDRK